MTGSTKQSILSAAAAWIASFAPLLAMTRREKLPRISFAEYDGSVAPDLLLTDTSASAIIVARHIVSTRAPREGVMAKGQMRSNKEKKKPKADKNLKKGGAAPSPFASGKTPAGQSPNSRKS
jgi:hypothetical protein